MVFQSIKKNMKIKYAESGRTMLEMMAVLSITGVIMYGAVVGIRFGVNMYKVTATYNDLEQAAEDIRDIYSWKAEYDEDIEGNLCETTTTWACQDNQFPSRWSGVEIEFVQEQEGHSFVIQLSGLSRFACERLLKLQWNHLTVRNDACGRGSSSSILSLQPSWVKTPEGGSNDNEE